MRWPPSPSSRLREEPEDEETTRVCTSVAFTVSMSTVFLSERVELQKAAVEEEELVEVPFES